MKKMKSLLIAAVLFVGVGSTAVNAQSKVAHIDVQVLMGQLPAMKTAQEDMKKLSEGYDKEFQAMFQEYQAKINKYESEAPTVGDAVNQERQVEVNGIQERLQSFRSNAEQELQKKQYELQQPILEKTLSSINKVGKAKGYDYVLDSSVGSGVLMAAPSDSILEDVKKELGVK